jgi:hypothetical protein
MIGFNRASLVCVFLLASAGAALGRDVAASACTAADLKGNYGFTLRGRNIEMGDYALVGVFEVDGRGGFKGKGLQSLDGKQARLTFTGTYTVEDDCIGVADLLFGGKLPAKVLFVIVSDGSEVLLMDVGETIETGMAKKIDAGMAKKPSSTRPQNR